MEEQLLFPFEGMDRSLREICCGEQLFDLYRLVEPNTHKVYRKLDGRLEAGAGRCYQVWNRNSPCANCVSRHCCWRQQHFFKMEYLSGSIFLILAIPVEMDGIKLSLELVKDVTNCISVADQNQKDNVQVLDIINRYNHLMVHDSFTGLYNKLYISDQLEAMVKNGETNLVGAMLDLDDFKEVNDTYGHYTGDQVLRGVAGVLERQCGAEGIWAGRLGGDEFCLFFQGIGMPEAKAACREAVWEIEKISFRKDRRTFHVSVSMGVAELRPGDTQETFLDRLDQEMYRNKTRYKTGRGGQKNNDGKKDQQMRMEEFYEDKGDYRQVLERFSGNAGLLEKFLRKLPQDNTYASLCRSVEEGDPRGIEMNAHTLKGVAGNLGLEGLQMRCARLVDFLRSEEDDPGKARELFLSIQKEYETVVADLALLD